SRRACLGGPDGGDKPRRSPMSVRRRHAGCVNVIVANDSGATSRRKTPMNEQNKKQREPDLAQRNAGGAPAPAPPQPPGTGYASHPAAGTGPAGAPEIVTPEGPETERGGSAAPHSTSRLNEEEDGQ